MISGKPVRSETSRTGTPASDSSPAVPPVETSSIPSSARPRANSTIPVLSETESSARPTFTFSEVVGSRRLTESVPGCIAPDSTAR